jgi:hypothetical protein
MTHPGGNQRRAIIAGIAGQDGSYLAELLVGKGYRVLGFLKKDEDTTHLASVAGKIVLEETELVRKDDILRWTRLFGPDEVYNFAALSFIPDSWDDPYRAFQVNTLLVAAFLEVLKDHCPSARFYQASSSEIFGDPPESPQDESTPHNPVTPYGVSKLAAHLLAGLYRRRYGMHVTSGILYNHGRIISSHRRSRGPPPGSRRDRGRSCGWGTSMPGATGVSPGISLRGSGGCCSRSGRRITCWRPGKPIRSGTSSISRSPTSACGGRIM